MITESDIRQIKGLMSVGYDGEQRLFQNEPMSRHTSFGAGGPAEVFIDATGEELQRLVPFLREKAIPYIVIGAGSNLLVSDKGIPGVVICIGKWMMTSAIQDPCIEADSGCLLPVLSNMAADNELSGLEFAAGIPGSLGGAITMNAGAYGGEICDVIESVTVLDKSGGLIKMSPEECGFSYRHSIFLERDDLVITGARLRLEKRVGGKDEIKAKMRENMEKRKSSQPIEFRSAGSTFKRVDTGAGDAASDRRPAWQLVQEADCKGLSVGGAQVSEKHCGFVINKGDATATDIYSLIQTVRDRVREKSGIVLDCEVRFLGDFS